MSKTGDLNMFNSSSLYYLNCNLGCSVGGTERNFRNETTHKLPMNRVLM